jgi:ELP3 family radical SAM enzyme/protein acetyltransferase
MEDIEDTVPTNLEEFVKELSSFVFDEEKDFQKRYNEMKVKYKLCPSKPHMRQMYNQLLVTGLIFPNRDFLKYTLKRKCRSTSGVTVITILTSPTPEYTNIKGEKVKQTFSCGESCAYCPNEPESRLILEITDMNTKGKKIKVSTEDDIHLIRMLSYLVKDGNQYEVEKCSEFKNDNFIITFKNEITDVFIMNEIVIGVKIAQPRSYLSTEPAVLRANRNNFDPVLQIYDRSDALNYCGHEVDKIEVLVLGGTWDHYPIEYQREFIRDIYYSINSLTTRIGARLSLEEEIGFAQTSKKRIIGLTLETRPDCISLKQIKKLREFNVTRLQIGVQHIDNKVLEYIERGSTVEETIYGNYLWKQNGGKVDWHLMPDLPGSSIEKDLAMFEKIFGVYSVVEVSKNHFVYHLKHPELQADQLKIYPCSVVDWTKIKEWYENGSYQPYSEDEESLIRVIVCIKQTIFPWMRLNRIIRDIPNLNILGGNANVNLRQKILARGDVNCQCIRCREVKNNTEGQEKAELFIREYNGYNSTEYFISYESPDQQILYGFARLRINHVNDDLIYNELKGCSFIRELHVYGSVVAHDLKGGENVQHMGFGKRLLKKAEEISLQNGIFKIAIISGVGVREYYENQGYTLCKNYMMKQFYEENKSYYFESLVIFTIGIICMSIIYDGLYL